MDFVAMKMILISALVVSLWAATNVNADPTCNPNTFEPGSAYEANVATVLEGIRVSTANAENRVFSMHLTGPDVFGGSSCVGSITLEDCTACLTTAVNAIKATCIRSMGASDSETNCQVAYST